ncbi:MAG: ABC-three component system protein [Gemmatimonadota bacterium]
MAKNRKGLKPADELALLTQVGGRCPLCSKRLFYKKRGRRYKDYDTAHIYPLNPTLLEQAELQTAPRLSTDPNDPDNLIPLCKTCHGRFDKPRTLEEYVTLADLKEDFLRAAAMRDLQIEYPIEVEIRRVLAGLAVSLTGEVDTDLNYDPQKVDRKLDDTMPGPTRRKIQHAVNDYFVGVRNYFKELERDSPGSSELIFAQVRTFYLSQKPIALTQGEVFASVVDWMARQEASATRDAAEAVAAFFVQNCEVFE